VVFPANASTKGSTNNKSSNNFFADEDVGTTDDASLSPTNGSKEHDLYQGLLMLSVKGNVITGPGLEMLARVLNHNSWLLGQFMKII
jgi:hypothetical protein